LSAVTSDGFNCNRYSAILSASSSSTSGYAPVIALPGFNDSGSCIHLTNSSLVGSKYPAKRERSAKLVKSGPIGTFPAEYFWLFVSLLLTHDFSSNTSLL